MMKIWTSCPLLRSKPRKSLTKRSRLSSSIPRTPKNGFLRIALNGKQLCWRSSAGLSKCTPTVPLGRSYNHAIMLCLMMMIRSRSETSLTSRTRVITWDATLACRTLEMSWLLSAKQLWLRTTREPSPGEICSLNCPLRTCFSTSLSTRISTCSIST